MTSIATPAKTYRAATAALLVTAVTKDRPWFVLQGITGKRIQLQRITLSCPTLTAAELLRIGLQKYSAAIAGGTATALTKVPATKDQGASTATLCQVYTAVPNDPSANLIGNIAVRRVMALTATPAATDSRPDVVFDFRSMTVEPPTLDTTAESFALVYLTADAGSAVSMMLEVEWTEQ